MAEWYAYYNGIILYLYNCKLANHRARFEPRDQQFIIELPLPWYSSLNITLA